MNIFVRFKIWNAKRKRLIGIRKQIELGAPVDAEERELFVIKNKKTPEQYKTEYDQRQADIAERQRVLALDKAEKKYSFPGLYLREDKDGLYYFGNRFVEYTDKYYLVDFQWAGPVYNVVSHSVTTGTDRHSSNAGKAIVGGVLFGPVGLVAGAAGKKNTKINHHTVTTSEQKEIDTSALLVFINARTRERVMKQVTCNTTWAKKYTSLRYTSL